MRGCRGSPWPFRSGRDFTPSRGPLFPRNSSGGRYKAPGRKTLSNGILESRYETVQNRINELMTTVPNLNVVTDESSDCQSRRVCNISIHSGHGKKCKSHLEVLYRVSFPPVFAINLNHFPRSKLDRPSTP
jgi:hypothetical protein